MSTANLGLTPRDASPGVKSGRLASTVYPKVFCDLVTPLGKNDAEVESSRCYYCYDAPCIRSCPSEIDIPSFIRKIGNGNVRGAAIDILDANILGGSCARLCPVETLCQEACVRDKADGVPVAIGALQRFATDDYFKSIDEGKAEQHFTREKSNGKKIAIVGAGPAGLSAAHHLSRFGFAVEIFEAKAKAGGLNEYGIAPYKLTDDFAQKEVTFLLSLGGIEIHYGKALGRDFTIESLKKSYDAVFLGIGLATNNGLGVPGEELVGVQDATKKIEEIRQAKDLSKVSVGQHVLVIGGGNTAVDIAVQMKRLGAEFVTLVYRRGTEQMGATGHEQEIAATNGVLIKTWAMPKEVRGDALGVTEMEFEYTELNAAGKLVGTSQTFTLKADQVFKAIGQKLVAPVGLEIKGGKILVDENFMTTLSGVYAGGDCVGVGEDLTVTSVQHGKLAARSIFRKFFPGVAVPFVPPSANPQDDGGGLAASRGGDVWPT
jgi:dihydropyrimidine dehydrogenase (NAD+) subunit PreT